MEQVIRFEDKHGDVYTLLETGQESCEGCVFDGDEESCREADDACCFVKGVWVRD